MLLESLACGTPVVATRIWGTPEVVRSELVGELFLPRSAEALAAAVQRLLGRGCDRVALRRYAEGFGWDETSAAQRSLFADILAASRGSLPGAA